MVCVIDPMAYNPFAAYQETKILSASPVQLVHMAYEGAIEAVENARAHLAAGRIQERSQAITKAQLIITELQASLDYTKGGDISVQLGRLYDYMQRRLTEANFRQMEEPLGEVQNLLQSLDEAWKEIAGADNSVAAAVASSSPWSSQTVLTSSSPWASQTEDLTYARTGYTL